MTGTLALVGSGEYLPPIEALDRLLLSHINPPPGVGAPARVACLATAAGTEGPERISYWQKLGEAHFTRLGCQVDAVPVIDRASADDISLAKRIRAANFVYLSGGKPDYLYRSLQGTRALEAILAVLDSGGVVAGCSAGAMIFGEKVFGFRNLSLLGPGFGRLPGAVILPHFDEIPTSLMLAGRAAIPAALTLVGIPANTALIAHDGRLKVAGSGAVSVLRPRNREEYTASSPAFTL